MAANRPQRLKRPPKKYLTACTPEDLAKATARPRTQFGHPGKSAYELKRKPKRFDASGDTAPLALRPPHDGSLIDQWPVADIMARVSVAGAGQDSFLVKWVPIRVVRSEVKWWITHYNSDLYLIRDYGDNTTELTFHQEYVWESALEKQWVEEYDADIGKLGSLMCVVCMARYGSGLALKGHMTRRHGGCEDITSMCLLDGAGDYSTMIAFQRGRCRVMIRDKLVSKKVISEVTCRAGPLPFMSGIFGAMFGVPGVTFRYMPLTGTKVASYSDRLSLVPILGQKWWLYLDEAPNPNDETAFGVSRL